MSSREISVIPDEVIINKMYLIRGEKVMLDYDLAELYDVPTKVFNQSVKRSIERFPEDFMFQLTNEEAALLRSQSVTSKEGRGGRRYLPFAFTEQGVAMLASVLNSDVAVKVNIRIIRIYTKLRKMLMTNSDLLLRMEKIETELAGQGEDIETVFNYLDQFIKQQEQPKTQIGFKRLNEQ